MTQENELWQKIATPTRFAVTVSKEFMGAQYVPYPWILAVEKRVLEAIADPKQRFIILNVPPQNGKHFSHEEVLPTPHGWTRMGDLKVGDTLYGRDGSPTKVTGIFDSIDQPMRRLYFTDGTSINAGVEHLWHVRDRTREVNRSPRRWWEGTVSTAQIEAEIERGGHKRWAIPVCRPLQGPDADLSIDPWILGYWLGNGATDAASLTTHMGDAEYVHARVGEGNILKVEPERGSARIYMRDTVGQLRDLGVLGCKHIPAPYLRASETQRRELLAGLIDSDGFTGGGSGQIELCLADERLARDVEELVRSLGEKPRRESSPAAYRKDGVRTVTGTRYRLFWTPRECPAQSPRKVAMWRPAAERKGDRLCWRYVDRVEEIPSAPSRCITVDAPDSLFVAGRDFIVSHNTTTFGMFLSAWYLGMYPSEQEIFIAYAAEYAESWGLKTRNLLAKYGPRYFGVGVSTQQSSAGNWKTDQGFGGMLSVGIGGGITGNPGNLIIIDDVIKGMEDASSISTKRKHLAEYDGSISTRFQENTTVLITATRFAEDDLSGALIARMDKEGYDGDKWEVISVPAIAEPPEELDLTDDEIAEWTDFLGRHVGEGLKGRFSERHYYRRRSSIDPFTFSAVYQQRPSVSEGGMFPKQNWRYWDDTNLPRMVRTVRAWDLAATEGGGDYTVGSKFGLGENGDLYLLDRKRFQKGAGEVEGLVVQTAQADGFETKILIEQEKAGAGKALVEHYKRILAGFFVAAAKVDGAKEVRARPYSAMQQNGRVWLPSTQPDMTRDWVNEHNKMMGDGRRPRHDDQIDTGAYCCLDLIGQGASEMWIPGEEEDDPASGLIHRSEVDAFVEKTMFRRFQTGF